VDAALASGESAREYLVSLGIPRDRVFLKCDVVDNTFFHRLAEETRADLARYRREHAVPERFFVFPGRVMEIKNHLGFLEAYRRYVNREGEKAWGLLMLGSGPLDEKVDARVAELALPWVQRRPYATPEDVARYYALASALVLPSRSETWGLVVNEANAAGCPVLVSKNCFVCEHLVVDGENGWTFDPYNLKEITDALSRMAGQSDAERARMGQAGRRLVEQWDVDDHAEELLKAIACGCRDKR
jgi:glycosyltransferase involved in cell wall biosynthesis